MENENLLLPNVGEGMKCIRLIFKTYKPTISDLKRTGKICSEKAVVFVNGSYLLRNFLRLEGSFVSKKISDYNKYVIQKRQYEK